MKKNCSFQVKRSTVLFLGLILVCFSSFGWGPNEWPNSIRMADFILSLQNSDGAIEDEPGGGVVNEDSNMEYALIGLGAAYDVTKDAKYLIGLEKGIAWLANRMEMTDPFWKGSFAYVYSFKPPYNPIPTSPDDPAISDVRGVDATSTLFVYLLYLHQQVSGSSVQVNQYATHAKAALDFIIAHNLDADGFCWSSWHKWVSDGNWHVWKFKYTADQGDVWLGFKAGALLYDQAKYGPIATTIESKVCTLFYGVGKLRFCLGRDEYGTRDWALEGFNGIFPNGYLPWLFGSNTNTEAAYKWLQTGLKPNGSISINTGPRYALSVAMYGLSSYRLGKAQPTASFNWLNKYPPFDTKTGGVFDTPSIYESLYSNVASFSLMSLMGWAPSFTVSKSAKVVSPERDIQELTVFPNPASRVIFIEGYNPEIKKTAIYNSVGSKLAEYKFTNQVNTDKLPSGTYYLRFINQKQEVIQTEKIIVHK